jgi:hypothetical protein
MAEKRVCRDFIKNPKQDPIDGHRLVPGKNPYKGYVALCLENKFPVEYMLNDDFINELSSKPKNTTVKSPRNISIPRSPPRSPLRSQPLLPRSVPSATRSDNLPIRSEKKLEVLTPQSTQSIYPRVVGPSVQPVVVNRSTRSLLPAPTPVYTERTEQIGTERFDPDPVTTVTTIPGRSVRETVRGPYGRNGEDVVVSGVHKLPGQVVYSTTDIPEHEVRSVHNGYNMSNISQNRVASPAVSYSTRTEQIGTERFDPDPVTTVTNIPGRSVRETVRGPYGRNGENVIVSGVHKLPGQVVYSTADIPEHEVRSVSNGVRTVQNKVSYPAPSYNARTEKIGNETFDPDPVTTVTDIPSRSVRTTVKGPYGPAGENVVTTGVYTSAGRRVYSTADIPEHEVRSFSRQPRYNTEF